MVDVIKISEFPSQGSMENDFISTGLVGGLNTNAINSWVFLPPGTTGDRPTPAASMYYRLRLNTSLETYEYYDPTALLWVPLSGSGTGTVNVGVTNDLAFYAASGQTISPINGAVNSVLTTNGAGLPALRTTLPSGLTIPGATITGSTAALTAGSVVAAPSAGTDIANKTYVDSILAGAVTSITGTTNQIIASSPTGAVTLSLPQDIALGSTPTFVGLTLSAIPLGPSSGGTGIDNGTKTLTLGGNTVFSGAFASTFTMTGVTNVTFPTSGTLATVSQIPVITPSALTGVDDTNVTATLGGTPATALLQAVSITLGWSGQLAFSRGGTNVNAVPTSASASNFAAWNSSVNLPANNFLWGYATTATAAGTTTLLVSSAYNQYFTGVTTQTVQLPDVTIGGLALGHSFLINNNSTGIVTVQSNGSNTITAMAAGTSALFTAVSTSVNTAAAWNSDYQSVGVPVTVSQGGTGVTSLTAYAVLIGGTTSTGAIQSIGPGTAGQVYTSNGAGAAGSFQDLDFNVLEQSFLLMGG